MQGIQPMTLVSMDSEFGLVLEWWGHEGGTQMGLLKRGRLDGKRTWISINE